MPESRRPGESSINVETVPPIESAVIDRAALLAYRLRSDADVDAQRAWQESGSVSERQARGVFDALHARTTSDTLVSPVPVGLPDTDFLTAELARSASDPAYQPSDAWRETIEKLRHHTTAEGEMNVLDLLVSSKTRAVTRFEWWQKEIAGLFRYTLEKDWARLRDAEEKIPPVAQPEQLQQSAESVPSSETPPPKQKQMQTSMDELRELKEGGGSGYFSVHAFWGGYYRENIYERHAGGATWEQNPRVEQPAPEFRIREEERVFRGSVEGGTMIDLPMPYGFAPDPRTLQATGDCTLVVDEHGCFSVDARAAIGTVSFTVVIGKPERSTPFLPVAPVKKAVEKTYAGAEAQMMLRGLTGATVEKAREIKRFVQATLTYSNDATLNTVYASHASGYFAAIEQHKKADCDVANAYYINLLSVAGISARMATGHYVKNTDRRGAAVMRSGTRHAWAEVWDEAGKTWVRFDATPSKDPTLDDERPDERAEEEAGPKPGDYGEQEAHQLSKEELDAWRQKLADAAERAKEKTPEQLQDEQFAKETDCTVPEAVAVRAKIEAARRMRDHKGRVIRSHLSEEFQKIVESNYKKRLVWKGPVRRSEGDEMDDLVMIGKDVQAGSANPLGYSQEATEMRLTQAYGGMDVYVVADRSVSMEEIDPASQKSKKEEQQLALFLLLDSVYGFSYKTEVASKQDQLISPLSVRSSVVAFQADNTDTVKPLSSAWKPKEQYDVWKGLESNVGGGTPAHLGLARVRHAIEKEIAHEKKQRHPSHPEQKKRLRLAIVFMDGEVDDEASYLAEQKKLEELGVSVSSWGMTESARKIEAYPNGHCVPSVREMIEPVTEHIIKKAQALRTTE